MTTEEARTCWLTLKEDIQWLRELNNQAYREFLADMLTLIQEELGKG
jgi:hypothetical protein